MTNDSVQYFEPDLDFLTWLKITLFQSHIWYAPAGMTFFSPRNIIKKPVLAMWASNHSFRRVSQPTGGEDL